VIDDLVSIIGESGIKWEICKILGTYMSIRVIRRSPLYILTEDAELIKCGAEILSNMKNNTSNNVYTMRFSCQGSRVWYRRQFIDKGARHAGFSSGWSNFIESEGFMGNRRRWRWI
jgi:hypothetical protein